MFISLLCWIAVLFFVAMIGFSGLLIYIGIFTDADALAPFGFVLMLACGFGAYWWAVFALYGVPDWMNVPNALSLLYAILLMMGMMAAMTMAVIATSDENGWYRFPRLILSLIILMACLYGTDRLFDSLKKANKTQPAPMERQ